MTPHFSLEELTLSETAEKLGIINSVMPNHKPALMATALCMEQVRALLGCPIDITSGYRNPAVNSAVGGVPNSAHAVGYACDFHARWMDDLLAAKLIRDSKLVFDQLILEQGRCVHIAFGPELRRQVLRQPGGPGSTVYEGLE